VAPHASNRAILARYGPSFMGKFLTFYAFSVASRLGRIHRHHRLEFRNCTDSGYMRRGPLVFAVHVGPTYQPPPLAPCLSRVDSYCSPDLDAVWPGLKLGVARLQDESSVLRGPTVPRQLSLVLNSVSYSNKVY
jgi:hypothetical protein